MPCVIRRTPIYTPTQLAVTLRYEHDAVACCIFWCTLVVSEELRQFYLLARCMAQAPSRLAMDYMIDS